MYVDEWMNEWVHEWVQKEKESPFQINGEIYRKVLSVESYRIW